MSIKPACRSWSWLERAARHLIKRRAATAALLVLIQSAQRRDNRLGDLAVYLRHRSEAERELAYREHVRALATTRLRAVCIVLAVVFTVDGVFQFIARPEAFAQNLGSRFAALLVCALIFVFVLRQRSSPYVFLLAGIAVVVTAVDVETAILTTGGQESMFFVGLILLAVAACLFFPFGARAALAVCCAVAAVFSIPLALARTSVDPKLLADQAFFFCCGALVATVGAHLTASLRRSEFSSRLQLEDEKERSDRLLLNVLPRAIAERLKAGEGKTADRHPEASVLFADIVGFTPLSEKIPADDLVGLLNEIFSAFDRRAAELGLEKIKTIGDAYMVAGGLPEPRRDHLEAMAEMALEMLQTMVEISRRRGLDLNLRIGLDCGPVVAGVIGATKFSYDVWGDMVNTASRMESHGAPGQIQVTEAVRARLEGGYIFSEPREIEVKGKGTLRTSFLVGRRNETRHTPGDENP